jgi:hypothetical protein
MKKLEHIKLDFSSSNEKQQPLYCPFTGGLLVPSDPIEEILDYPQSVIAAFAADSLDFSFLREGLNESDFEDFEDFDELASILEKKISKDSGIMIIEVGYYGKLPFDYGGWVIFLEIPNCFLS